MIGSEFLPKAITAFIGAALKTPKVQSWLSGVRDRSLAGHISPDDRGFIKDVRTAQLSAIKWVALHYEEWLTRNPSKMEPGELVFAGDLRKFVDERLKKFSPESIDDLAVTKEDLELILDGLFDFRETKESSGPEMRSIATRRALNEITHEVGKGREVPSNFYRLFKGDDEPGWYEAFSFSIVDRIRTNESFKSLLTYAQLTDLRHAMDSVAADTSKNYGELINSIRRLEKAVGGRHALANTTKRPFLKSPARPSSEADQLGSFRYYFAYDPFQGRESDLEEIERVLFNETDSRQFKWLGLYGDAGSGKSRFAMQLLERRNKEEWDCGFVDKTFALDKESAEQWKVEQPTFIIVDYAASYPGIVSFIHAFAQRENGLKFPVRLLLIERSQYVEIFRHLVTTSEDNVRQARTQLRSGDELYQLSPLTPEQIVDLMTARMGDMEGQPQGYKLIDVLHVFDPHFRPLFAAIVADALKAGSLPRVKPGKDDEDARCKLFRYLIQRERENVWTPRLENRAELEKTLAQHETMAALSTMVRGLQDKTYRRLIDESYSGQEKQFLPNPPSRDLYGAMSDEAAQGGYGYPAITPDLIGEYFVLDMVEERRGFDIDQRAERRNWLIQTAWHVSRWDMAIFARMCFQDYPKRTISVGYFITKNGKIDSQAQSSLIRAIADEMAAFSRAGPPSLTQLERSFELASLIDEQMMDQAQKDVNVARNISAVWEQVANIAARAINKHVGHISVGLDDTFKEKIEARLAQKIEPCLARDAFGKATSGQAKQL